MNKYLPLFINLQNKKIVIFGGGRTGYDKAKVLIKYCPNVTVISNKFYKKFRNLKNITLIQKNIEDSDLKDDYSLVISATNNETLNKKIFEHYAGKNILINVVDKPDLCNVIFPAILERKDITFAISSGGKVPGFSRYLKQCLKKWLPSNTHKILNEIYKMRQKLKEKIKNYKKRMLIIRKVLKKHDFLSPKYQKMPFKKIKKIIHNAFDVYLVS